MEKIDYLHPTAIAQIKAVLNGEPVPDNTDNRDGHIHDVRYLTPYAVEQIIEAGGSGASSADRVSYDNTESGLTATDVQGAIDETLDKVDAMSAAKVSYDNSTSGLTATTVQSAIDEVGANLGEFKKVTYTELVALRDGKKLVGGKKYRITDYECTSSDEETQCAGHNYDIIVTALDDETLSEECSAIQHEGDTYFNGQNLNSWKVWYCLDNDASRFSWAKQGGKQAKVEFYGMEAICAVLSENDTTYEGLPIKISGSLMMQSFIAYTQYGVANGIFDIGGYTQEVEINTTYIGGIVGGKGVVYRLIDDKGNDVSYDLKNLMFKRYKITSEDSQFFGRYYGVKNSEIYNVDEEDYQFFYTFSVEEESVEDYSITNFVHSNKLYGNGNYNNIFVNTSFGNYCYFNTFGNYCHSNTFGYDCYSNTFGNYCYSNTFGYDCYSNTFGNYCYSNTFGYECYSNTFGDYCQYNTFGNNCHSNTFGNECYSNTFGNYCYSNTFGYECYSNTFGNYCHSNTFGNYCYSNTFGNYCYSNTFGYDCYSNTFGNYCYSNTFGYECYSNTFGDYCQYNTFGNNCHSNTFDVSKTYNSCVVLDNVSGRNFSFVDYQDYDKNNYVQYCGYNSQGVLKYWTPADLVQ